MLASSAYSWYRSGQVRLSNNTLLRALGINEVWTCSAWRVFAFEYRAALWPLVYSIKGWRLQALAEDLGVQ